MKLIAIILAIIVLGKLVAAVLAALATAIIVVPICLLVLAAYYFTGSIIGSAIDIRKGADFYGKPRPSWLQALTEGYYQSRSEMAAIFR